MKTDHHLHGWRARGKQEMRDLAVAAFAALEGGDMPDLLESLEARVIGRTPQDVMDVKLVDDVWEWRFKPFIELLLHHIIGTARSSAVSPAQRRNEIVWAVEMAGF